MSDPLQIKAASDGSTTISSLATVEKTAAAGLYPIEYTVYYRGTYVMDVTGPDGQVKATFHKEDKDELLIVLCCIVRVVTL